MQISKLHILGKVSPRVQAKMGLSTHSKAIRREWFFVDYIWKSYPVGSVFDVFTNDRRDSKWNHDFKAKLIKVTDEFGSDFDEIPAGYKTICCFDFSPKIPDEIKELPVLSNWSERSKSVYLCQLDEIKREGFRDNRYFIFLIWKELKELRQSTYKAEDIAKILAEKYDNKNKYYFRIVLDNLIQSGKAKEKEEDKFELVE